MRIAGHGIEAMNTEKTLPLVAIPWLSASFYRDKRKGFLFNMKSKQEMQREIETRDLHIKRTGAQLTRALEEMLRWKSRAEYLQAEFGAKPEDMGHSQ